MRAFDPDLLGVYVITAANLVPGRSHLDVARAAIDGGATTVQLRAPELAEDELLAVARELGLSQSAVSHALTRLRDLFEDPLFIRRPHGLEATRRALELAPRVDALIDLAGETLAREGKFDPSRSERRFALVAPEFVTALIGAKLNVLPPTVTGPPFAVGTHRAQRGPGVAYTPAVVT
jgi:DNA-binding transcriptional ArsR family regulator